MISKCVRQAWMRLSGGDRCPHSESELDALSATFGEWNSVEDEMAFRHI